MKHDYGRLMPRLKGECSSSSSSSRVVVVVVPCEGNDALGSDLPCSPRSPRRSSGGDVTVELASATTAATTTFDIVSTPAVSPLEKIVDESLSTTPADLSEDNSPQNHQNDDEYFGVDVASSPPPSSRSAITDEENLHPSVGVDEREQEQEGGLDTPKDVENNHLLSLSDDDYHASDVVGQEASDNRFDNDQSSTGTEDEGAFVEEGGDEGGLSLVEEEVVELPVCIQETTIDGTPLWLTIKVRILPVLMM